jgi:hypothetical protein
VTHDARRDVFACYARRDEDSKCGQISIAQQLQENEKFPINPSRH